MPSRLSKKWGSTCHRHWFSLCSETECSPYPLRYVESSAGSYRDPGESSILTEAHVDDKEVMTLDPLC